jgi:amino acid permease
MLLATEVTAAGLVIEYWQSPVSVGVWIAIILVGEHFLHFLYSLHLLTQSP